MKKLLVILAVALTSCATTRNFSGYDFSHWAVTKNGKVVARVTSTEFELTPRGKMIQEISLTVEDISSLSQAEEIIRFVGKRFPKSKIELNLDGIQIYE